MTRRVRICHGSGAEAATRQGNIAAGEGARKAVEKYRLQILYNLALSGRRLS